MIKLKRRRLCECGCGETVKEKQRFIKGHNNKLLSKEDREKISLRMRGENNPTKRAEVKRKISESLKGKVAWNKNKLWPEDIKIKISIGVKQGHTKEGLKKIGDANKTRIWTDEAKEKCSRSRKGKCFKFTEEHRRNIGLTSKGRKKTQESKMKTSNTMKQLLQDVEFQEKFFKNRGVLPNKLELKIQDWLNELFPNEWKYIGDFQTFIGGKCPDFMNINGQKKLIEVFGDYWHKNDDPEQRINHFKEYGFNTLVLWESEINNYPIETKRKVVSFHGS